MNKNRFFESSYERLTKEELASLGIVLSAYRSFRGKRREHIAYVSMPVNTGKRFYDVLSENGVRTQRELERKLGDQALGELVLKPNIREGIAFADEFGRRENLLFIAPSVFEAKQWGWTSNAYMSLWYRMIGEFAGSLIVMDGWEYSTGSVQEVLFAMCIEWAAIRKVNLEAAAKALVVGSLHPGFESQETRVALEGVRRIPVYDSSKHEIRIDVAFTKVVEAIRDLRNRDLPCKELINLAWKFATTPFVSPFAMHPDFPDDYILNPRVLNLQRELYKLFLTT